MRLEPVLEGDRRDLARIVKDDLPFRQVEFQWLAYLSRCFQRRVGGVKRAYHAVEQRRGLVRRLTVKGRLHLFIAQRGDRLHEAAHEGVVKLVALRVDPHAHRDTGTRHPLVQRTQIARQPVGQHRDDAVGKIGRVAAPPRLAVQRRSGAHVMCDIGDGDPDDKTVGIARRGVGFDITGVIVVARVRRVDGDKGDIAQVFAPFRPCGDRGIGLGDHRIGKVIGDRVLVDRDKRHRARRGRIAKPRHDPGLGQAKPPLGAGLFGLDQFTILRATFGPGGDDPLLVLPLVDGHDASAFGPGPKDAQNPQRIGTDPADHPGGVIMRLARDLGDPREDAVARAKCGIAIARQHEDQRFAPVAAPLKRSRHQVAAAVRPRHLEHADGRQFLAVAVAVAPPRQRALFLKFLEDTLEVDPVGPLDAERLGDVALGGQGRVVGDPLQDSGFGGNIAHASG